MKNAERGWNGSVFVRERKWWGGCSTRDKNEKIYDAALLVACSDLYTVKYTVMYTVVYTPLYTPHTVAGVLWRYMQCAKGDKSIKRIPNIQRNSVKYAVFGGVREI